MAVSQDELLAEARRRGLIQNTSMSNAPRMGLVRRPSQDDLLAEAQRRGLIPARYIPPAVEAPPAPPAPEPSTFEGYVTNPLARGYNRLEQAANVAGAMTGILSPEEAAGYLAENERDIQGYALPSEVERGTQEIMASEGFWDTAGALWDNPAAVLNTATESLVNSAPALALGAAGAAAGSLAGPGGTAAGLAAGVGVGSGITEYLASINETLAERGMEPEQIEGALTDPAFMEAAKDKALKRGVAVGAFDAISGGIAGRVGKPVYSVVNKALRGGRVGGAAGVAAGAGAEIGLQAGAGASGEAAAQIATEGRITSPGAVGLEAAAEIIPGLGEAAIGSVGRRMARKTVDEQPDLLQRAKDDQRQDGAQAEPPGPRDLIVDPYANPGGFTMPEDGPDPDFYEIPDPTVDGEATAQAGIRGPAPAAALPAPLRGLPSPDQYGRRTGAGDGFTMADEAQVNALPPEDRVAMALDDLPAGRRVGLKVLADRAGLRSPQEARGMLQTMADRGLIRRQGKAWVRTEQPAPRRQFRPEQPMQQAEPPQPLAIERQRGIGGSEMQPNVGRPLEGPTAFAERPVRDLTVQEPVAAAAEGVAEAMADPPDGVTQAAGARTEATAPEVGGVEASTIAQPSDLDYERARRAYTWSSFSPENRAAEDQRSYASDVNGLYDDLLPLAETDDQKAILRREVERYAQNYRDRYGKVLDAKSRTASPMVTGPAKFPTERNRKRMDAEQRRMQEFIDWRDRARKAVSEAVQGARTGEQVASDAWASFKAEIDSEFASVAARDNGTGFGIDRGTASRSLKGKIQRRADNGQADTVRRALDYIREKQEGMKRPILTNRNSVWQLAEQAQEAQAQAEQQATAEPRTVAEFDGTQIIDDVPADRTRIYFDAKPEPEVTQALRKEGWKWSRTEGAWQRKRTPNAEQSAQRIVGRFYEPQAEVDAEAAVTTEQTANEPAATDAEPLGAEGQGGMFSLRRNPRVVEVNQEDVGPYKSREAWRRAATRAVKSLIGRRVRHGEMSGEVVISRNGVTHTLNNAADDLLLAATRLPDIIRTAQRSSIEPDYAGRPDIKAVHKLAGRVRVNGTMMGTQIVIRETRGGKFFYDLALIERARSQTGTESREAQVRSQSSQAAGSNSNIAPGEDDRNSIALSREALAALPATERELRTRLEQVGLSGKIALRMVEAIRTAGDSRDGLTAEGRYVRGLIEIALDAGDRMWTLNHEIIHALRGLGVIREREWNVLKRAVSRDRLAEVETRYSDQALTDEALMEEAIADLFADAAARGPLRGVVARVRKFFDALGNWLRGNGFQSADDVFARVESGEMGARPSMEFDGGEARYSIAAMRDKAMGPRPEPASPTPGQESLLSKIGTTDVPLRTRIADILQEVRENGLARIRRGLFDQFDQIGTLERAANDGKLLEGAASAYKSARLAQGIGGIMSHLINNGGIALRDGWVAESGRFKGGFAGIFKDISERGEMDLWRTYAIARRAKRLMAEGRENLLTEAEINAGLYEHPQERIERFEKAFDDFQAFNTSILDFAVEAGFIKAEMRDLWTQHGDYVPFNRILEGDVAGPGSKAGLAGQRANTKRLKGGDALLNDPIENMIMNMTAMVNGAVKNLAAQKTMALGTDAGVMEAVPPNWKPVRYSPEQAASALEDIGVEVQGLTPKQREQMLTLFDMTPPKDRDVVSIMVDGKPKYFRVTDPGLLSALQSMSPAQLGGVMTLFRMAKRVLTEGVTLMPDFMIANSIRDTLSAWVTTPNARFHPGAASVKGFKKALLGEPSYYALLAAGGGAGGFYDEAPRDVRKTLDDHLQNIDRKTILDTPRKLWKGWHQIGRASEYANRIAIYEALKKQGFSDSEAAYQARDLMDFQMRGDFAAARILIEMVPFLNARLQGLYRLGRGAASNPKAFILRGAIITAAAMALLAANMGDDRYEALEEWDKDTYWHVFVGDEHLRIPKPFEVGAIFGTIPERMVRLATGGDDGKVAAERMAAMFSDTFAMNPVPQLVKPITELWADKSFFTDRPIVGWQDGLPNPMQYRPGTSDTAKLMGEVFDASPVQIQHLIRGYFGSLGTAVLAGADVMARQVMDAPPKPASTVRDMPVIGRFWRGSEAERSTVYMTRLYEMHKEMETVWSGIREARKQGRGDLAVEMMEDNADLLRARPAVNNAVEQLRKINRRIRAVYYSENMTAGDKQSEIDRLHDIRNRLTQRVVTALDR